MKEIFMRYVNECYLVVSKEYPNSVFYIYDNQILRLKKIHRILGKEDFVLTNVRFRHIKDKIFFERNNKNGVLYVKQNEIWKAFENITQLNFVIICDKIRKWLEKDQKIKNMLLCNQLRYVLDWTYVEDNSKFDVLKPKSKI